MTSEFRIIQFRASEVVEALVWNIRSEGARPPKGKAAKLSIDAEKYGVTVSFREKSGEASAVHFEAEVLKKALVGYCVKKSIKLPMAPPKTLQIVGGSLAFVIEMRRPPESDLVPMQYVQSEGTAEQMMTQAVQMVSEMQSEARPN